MKYLISLILLCIATALTGCNGSSDDGAGTENSAPNATPFSGVTQTETPLSGNLKAEDPDGDVLTFSLVSAPVQGSVQIQPDGQFTYTPITGFTGNDQFTFSVSDGKSPPVSAVVSITIEVLQLSFSSFSREVFAASENSEPKSLRGRQVSNDISQPDFYDDLLTE
ncbi:cadherin-like domain-containing protein [Photobacterium sp. 1_MG-2023]|uniref:cadherin-like domain-containing protein n=1 Tax=Photobacterium sp. 1_MG-2023 TaxID=3062646 RepID=UPI0026E2E2AF|nr:cadherin-like domain-containing protein [Photobacterium sp. 1_MG-2023]MDO6705583.1 cadherin-like domain-containing protein [Photobacterium sp. 1_MG-2023]